MSDSSTLKPIEILLIEDNPGDVDLVREMLTEASLPGFTVTEARRLSDAISCLKSGLYDLVLLDLGLPDSKGIETLRSLRGAVPGLPVVVLTGEEDEANGLKAVGAGAQDYLVKGQIQGPVMIRSIRYAIERQNLLLQLEKSLKEIKILKGLLPICAYCKKIRDDQGFWQQMELYIHTHSGAEFSHGICPACEEKAFKELEEK